MKSFIIHKTVSDKRRLFNGSMSKSYFKICRCWTSAKTAAHKPQLKLNTSNGRSMKKMNGNSMVNFSWSVTLILKREGLRGLRLLNAALLHSTERVVNKWLIKERALAIYLKQTNLITIDINWVFNFCLMISSGKILIRNILQEYKWIHYHVSNFPRYPFYLMVVSVILWLTMSWITCQIVSVKEIKSSYACLNFKLSWNVYGNVFKIVVKPKKSTFHSATTKLTTHKQN